MFRSIVVGYEDRDQSRDALALATRLAAATRASLTVAHVYPLRPIYGPPDVGGALTDWERDMSRSVLDSLRPIAEQAGADARAVASPSAAHGLQALAEDEEADLIVLGSCHRGRLGQVFLGSVAERLLHGSPCAVAVAPAGFADREPPIDRVVVGFDGSPESRVALEGAAGLAGAAGAVLQVATVAEPPEPTLGKGGIEGEKALQRAIEQHSDELLAEAVSLLPPDVAAETTMLTGDAREMLVYAARRDGDLLVVGSRGYGPMRRVLLGAVSAGVLRSATSPVVVFPRGSSTPAADAERAAGEAPAGV